MSRGGYRVDWLQLLSADGLEEYRDARSHHHRADVLGKAVSLGSMVVVGFIAAAGALGIAAAEPAAKAERAQLTSRVIAARAAASTAEVGYLAARRDLAAAQRDAASGLDSALLQRLRIDEAMAGYAEVTGPGLVLTLNDATSPQIQNSVDLGLVIDRDVQHAVNSMWLAGAEAVSVNDRRLTFRSPIRNAGIAILVDLVPVRPPYVIRAIGDPQRMLDRFEGSAEWDELEALRERYGVRWKVERSPSLRLPQATSAFPRTAQVGGEG